MYKMPTLPASYFLGKLTCFIFIPFIITQYKWNFKANIGKITKRLRPFHKSKHGKKLVYLNNV